MSLNHDVELREAIRKTALLNAFKHDGKAEVGAVMGKILGERPELRGRIRDLLILISTVVKEVNDLSPEEQKSRIEEKWPETLVKEKITEEKKLPPLPNVKDYDQVVTRFSLKPRLRLTSRLCKSDNPVPRLRKTLQGQVHSPFRGH